MSSAGRDSQTAAYFERAHFTAAADFQDAAFADIASFKETVWDRDVSFAGARFGSRALFWEARFAGASTFATARADGEISFNRAVFGGTASFSEFIFAQAARFAQVTFRGDVSFAGAYFRKEADFTGSSFNGDLLDLNAFFNHTLDLRHTRIPTMNLQSVSLADSTFATGAKLYLQQADFQQIRFRWQQLEGHLTAADTTSLEDLEPVYATLRRQLQRLGLRGDADACFVEWMERQRHSLGWTDPWRYGLEFFRVTTGYGTHLSRFAFSAAGLHPALRPALPPGLRLFASTRRRSATVVTRLLLLQPADVYQGLHDFLDSHRQDAPAGPPRGSGGLDLPGILRGDSAIAVLIVR